MPQLALKRLFVAVELPQNIKERLTNLEEELKKSGADAKWVEPQNIHLTIKFLGGVPEEKTEEIQKLLSDLFVSRKPFCVTLDRLGCFPSAGSARIIWAGLEDKNKTLKAMAGVLDEALDKAGFEKETKEFQSHATLARLRSPRNKIALIEKINHLNQDFRPQTFTIDNITLFESRLSPKGPSYSVIHHVSFS